VHSPVSS